MNDTLYEQCIRDNDDVQKAKMIISYIYHLLLAWSASGPPVPQREVVVLTTSTASLDPVLLLDLVVTQKN
jgi:hypothetical protein